MSRAYAGIAFTPAVQALQSSAGSRGAYARLDRHEDAPDRLGEMEKQFIAQRDGFYQASVGEEGWPYVQFRGGPAGFLKIIDDATLCYADFRGNLQYISAGNLSGNDRVSLILMDYAARRRLKIFGRVRIVNADQEGDRVAALAMPGYRGKVERGVIISIEAFDWNCPQHITPRFTEAEIAEATAPLHNELAMLRAKVADLQRAAAFSPA